MGSVCCVLMTPILRQRSRSTLITSRTLWPGWAGSLARQALTPPCHCLHVSYACTSQGWSVHVAGNLVRQAFTPSCHFVHVCCICTSKGWPVHAADENNSENRFVCRKLMSGDLHVQVGNDWLCSILPVLHNIQCCSLVTMSNILCGIH